MSFRSRCCLLAFAGCFFLSGCYPPAENTISEEKNPYFQEGKSRVAARDFQGAIAAFEKALEDNPRSALAHFELGVLYEQNSDQTESDYINAMYHYQRAMKLRPTGYPYDNARIRLASCKRELVKAESLAPIYQSMQRELERLRDENQQLRVQLEALQPTLPTKGNTPPSTPAAPPRVAPGSSSGAARPLVSTPPSGSTPRVAVPPSNRTSTPIVSAERAMRPPLPTTPAPTMLRSHTVRSGDTLTAIARQYRVKPEAIVAANPGMEPRRLRVGQTLRIPAQ